MPDQPKNVLFLCTGNSARSILGGAILNRLGEGRFRAYSAGSQPKCAVNPHTIRLLQNLGYDTAGLRSKSWDEFAISGAPPIDFIFTVCDDAASEACPIWPGRPAIAHWGIPDPAKATGNEAEVVLAFDEAFRMLKRRIELFVALPLASLGRLTLNARLREIGGIDGATDKAREQS